MLAGVETRDTKAVAHLDNVAADMPLTRSTEHQLRKWLMLGFRLLFAGLIVAALLSYDAIDGRALVNALSRPSISIPGLLILLTAFALGGIRWFVILRAFNIKLRFRNVFEIYAIGAFFNTFLPGGTGGDAVRVLYAVRSVTNGKIACGMSVVADRISGLYGMMLVSVVLVLANADTVLGHPISRVVAGSLLVFFAGLNLVAVFALAGSRPFMNWALLRLEGRQERLYHLVRRSSAFLELVRHARASLGVSIAISMLVSFLLIGSIVIVAGGQGWRGLEPLDYACAAVVALLASTVPITPGGIGVAEGTFDYMCSVWTASGSPAAYGTIFLTYRLLSMTINLLGGIALATRQRH